MITTRSLRTLALVALFCTPAALQGQPPNSPSLLHQPKTGYVPREDLAEVAACKTTSLERHLQGDLRLDVPPYLLLGPTALLSATLLVCMIVYLIFQRCRCKEQHETQPAKRPASRTVGSAVVALLLLTLASPARARPTGYVPREDLVEVVMHREQQATWRPPMTGSFPDKYRCQKYLGPVRSQGNCGSCWNFSGTTAVEGALAKAGVLPVGEYVSPQFSMDCWRNGGCRGDDPSRVAEVALNRGLPTETDYGDYKARVGRCRGEPPLFKITDWGFCDGGGVASTDSIKAAMLEHGPISVCVAADGAFSSYQKGRVFRGNARGVNHAVVLVGWDDSLGKEGAWLLRNSWGSDWGDQGHMWIEYGANRVGTAAFWCHCDGPPIPWLWTWVWRVAILAFAALVVIAVLGGAFYLGRRFARRPNT